MVPIMLSLQPLLLCLLNAALRKRRANGSNSCRQAQGPRHAIQFRFQRRRAPEKPTERQACRAGREYACPPRTQFFAERRAHALENVAYNTIGPDQPAAAAAMSHRRREG
mmetsp:Transcript_8053/g.25115  ORF Transcript_8053/g.25115 Transcript_8053/m.25115 type:complete len:110 (+) Transcript_8053:372-701(+)|eukprot:scaffold184780_cov32-Tisochrysis_lutea.AAC.2